MPEYLSPGVYVEEVDRGPKPIEGVGTAMPVFIGFTEKAQITERSNGETITHDVLGLPQLVTNWSQYVERFGGLLEGAYLPHSVYGYFQNGGSRCYVLSIRTIPKAQTALLNEEGKPQLIARAKQAGFDGLRLRVKIEPSPPPESEEGETPEPAEGRGVPFNMTVEREKSTGGWQAAEVVRDISLTEIELDDGAKRVAVAYKNNRMPQLIDLLIPNASMPLAELQPREQEQSLSIENKVLSLPTSSEFQGDVTERTGVDGLAALDDVTMVCTPDLMSAPPGQKLDLNMVKAVQTMIIGHCELMGDRVAILDAPPNMSPQKIKKWRMDVAGFDTSYAALYYPWIEIMDPVTNRSIYIPPSGHMAGIWARSDNTRGVHKAPANEVVRGATGLAINVTKGEQDTLNPIGVNCIRSFPGMGIRVWGARTLASSNPAWRYINVRRLFNFVEKSIERGTQWVVFEPNDPTLWGQVVRDVSSFLSTVWVSGALFGRNPSEAFYVKCDEELNPSESRDLGRLIIEIGMCPVKPAEFVIFRISQWAGPGA